MKSLVVYYSRTGYTEKVAQEISKRLNSEVEQIKDFKNRKGFLGFMISGYEAVTKKLVKIADVEKNPKDYDLVIICSPVWAGSISSPIRTYLNNNGKNIQKVAFVATCDDNPGQIFEQMASLSCEPIQTFSVQEKEIKQGSFIDKLGLFINGLK